MDYYCHYNTTYLYPASTQIVYHIACDFPTKSSPSLCDNDGDEEQLVKNCLDEMESVLRRFRPHVFNDLQQNF